VHRVSVGGYQLGVDLGDREQLAGSLESVERGRCIAQRNPQVSETVQDDTSLRIGDDLDRALAFGGFAPWVYL
jgi:hypothetical protein